MVGRLEEHQRNSAFIAVMLIGFACFLYVMNILRSVLIPVIWAAFFAMPLTLIVGYIDAKLVQGMSWLLHIRSDAGSREIVEFKGRTGESDIRMVRNLETEAFLKRLNSPCIYHLPMWLSAYCRRRAKLVTLEVVSEGDVTPVALGPEVNRLVQGWNYYISDPSDGISLLDQSNVQAPLAHEEGVHESDEMIVGLYIDQDELYPAVITDEIVESRVSLIGTLTMNKKSSLSWLCSFLITMTTVLAMLVVFAYLLDTGVRSITDNLDTYKKGINDLVDWAKPLLPAEIWTSLEEKAHSFVNDSLPALASDLATQVENVGYQMIFFVIYLMFWIAEPLPISSPVMQVFKSYLLLKTFVCLLLAVLMSWLLYMLNCRAWPLFFEITFILNYIPEVGAIACAVLCVPAILLDGDISVQARLWNLLWLVIGGTLIKILTGNVIEVRLYTTRGGQFMRMHPVILLVLIMICSAILGVTGAFLSVPIMAAVKYSLLSANMPDKYLNPLLVAIEGDERGPHKNYVDRCRSHSDFVVHSSSETTRRVRASTSGATIPMRPSVGGTLHLAPTPSSTQPWWHLGGHFQRSSARNVAQRESSSSDGGISVVPLTAAACLEAAEESQSVQ